MPQLSQLELMFTNLIIFSKKLNDVNFVVLYRNLDKTKLYMLLYHYRYRRDSKTKRGLEMNNDKLSSTPQASWEPMPFVAQCSSPYDDDSEDVEPGTYGYPYFLKIVHSLCQGFPEPDLQDIAADAWYSYLRRLERGDIEKPAAYIAKIIRNKFWDYLRKEKRRSPQPTIYLSTFAENPDLELAAFWGRDLINPVNEADEQVEKIDFLNNLAVVLRKVPPRQRRVVICTLLEKADDPLPIKQILRRNHIDASEMHWPSNQAEKRLLKASLPAARRTLAILLGIDLSQYKHRIRHSC